MIIRLENSRGISVDILTTGASVYRVTAPDRYDRSVNITMTLDSPDNYGKDSSYAGATLGPSAGRIPRAELEIDGRIFNLTRNEGDHHLHGGLHSLSRADWSVRDTLKKNGCSSVTLEARLFNGQDGYPGNRIVQAKFILNEQNHLKIKYSGQSDAATYFNISNHCYWNLSGDFQKPAQSQILRIAADSVWHNDAAHLPVERRAVKGSHYDFTLPREIDSVSYNNLYILSGCVPAVELYDPQSGRELTIETDYPALQFYSGGYLDSATFLQGGIPASAGCALAFEPQEFPVLCRHPSVLARPGSTWERNISYIFDIC